MLALMASLMALVLSQPEPVASPEPSRFWTLSRPAPFAVVELFTSEGCSSCPAADTLLAEIAADARKNGTRVFPLAFHVDYWDHLGWEDGFASKEFTARQRDYQRVLKNKDLYTPQMIVNGRFAFVGSDRDRATAAIDAALKHHAESGLWVETDRGPGERGLIVDCEAFSKDENAIIRVAVVENGLESKVGAGENSGRLLHHQSVVRVLKEIALTKGTIKYQVTFDLPSGVKVENASVIAFIQDPFVLDPKSGGILGAGAAAMPMFGPEPVVTDEDLASAVVTLKRTPGLGMCPDYDLTIKGDGSVEYHGRLSVAVQGPQRAVVPKEEVRRLLKAILRSDFFGLKDRYEASVTDLPSTTTTLSLGGRTKEVFDYADGPQRLRRLEDLVDEVAGSSKWVRKGP